MKKTIKEEMSKKMKSKCSNCGKNDCKCKMGKNGDRDNPPTKATSYINPKE